MKTIVCGLLVITCSFACVGNEEDCMCNAKFEDPENFLYTGKHYFKIHGPVDNKGHEHIMYVTKYTYKIDGCDYYLISLNRYNSGIIHSPKCRMCHDEKAEKDTIITNTMREILEAIKSMPQSVTKSEIENMLKKQENRLVKKIDDMLNTSDNISFD